MAINLKPFLKIFTIEMCFNNKKINCEILNIFSDFHYFILKWNTQQGERLVINVYYQVNPIK